MLFNGRSLPLRPFLLLYRPGRLWENCKRPCGDEYFEVDELLERATRAGEAPLEGRGGHPRKIHSHKSGDLRGSEAAVSLNEA